MTGRDELPTVEREPEGHKVWRCGAGESGCRAANVRGGGIMRMVRNALLALLVAACTRFGAVYPPRPSASPSAPVADPAPARVVAHVSVSAGALRGALDDAIPKSSEGDFALLGGQRHYTW